MRRVGDAGGSSLGEHGSGGGGFLPSLSSGCLDLLSHVCSCRLLTGSFFTHPLHRFLQFLSYMVFMKVTKTLRQSVTTRPLNNCYDSLNNLKSAQAKTSLGNSSGFDGGKSLYLLLVIAMTYFLGYRTPISNITQSFEVPFFVHQQTLWEKENTALDSPHPQSSALRILRVTFYTDSAESNGSLKQPCLPHDVELIW